ncbi:MAG: tRNA (guanosine(46)-N7)-methyltransferase TrmB [Rubrivivax sp.]|nr:tRNA (guanosine(46)-N7)-methyltransferase TrmB [Rubrivivax sp.]
MTSKHTHGAPEPIVDAQADARSRRVTPAMPSGAPRARIRSYVLRGGRLGPGQQRALAELGPSFVLPWQAELPDWDAAFGRRAPRLLEIGFGMGDATAQVAAALPDHDLIGVEVHEAGVGALLKLLGERGLANVRIVRHDAVEVLRTMIAPASLAGIHVWFPDPWPKKRHHKRRLLQPAFVAELALRLVPGGYLHCATDWQPYAEQMLQVLASEPRLRNSVAAANGSDGSAFAPRPPWRPLTRFEQRGLKLGHGVWDLVFVRC